MPGATPLSELMSDPATTVVGGTNKARKIEVSRLRCVRTCRRQVRACCGSRACASVGVCASGAAAGLGSPSLLV